MRRRENRGGEGRKERRWRGSGELQLGIRRESRKKEKREESFTEN